MADSATPQFRRAVVALSGGHTDRPIVALAARLAKAGQAELVGIHVVEIDWTLPLDADVAGRSEDAQRVLDLVIAGLPFRRRFGGDFAIGRTSPYILKNAPCAVWVIREAMPEEQA